MEKTKLNKNNKSYKKEMFTFQLINSDRGDSEVGEGSFFLLWCLFLN